MSSEATDPADRLAEIKRRVYLAQPGPWCHRVDEWDESDSTDDSFSHCVKTADGITVVPRFRSNASDPDLEFIAHARDDVPWLVAEVERLRVAESILHKLVGAGLFRRDGIIDAHVAERIGITESEQAFLAAATDGTEAPNG